jgi:uncharacterized membrane-anchored protein
VTRRALFWALVAVQAAIPFGMVGLKEARYSGAERVYLAVQPVDPLDPLRGEYVRLSYPISRIVAPAGTVYVPLFPAGPDTWTGTYARTDRPESGTYIRGRSDGSGQIVFGIEHFYVQEGTGRRYEDAVRQQRLYAQIAIDGDGQGRLEHVVIR